MTQEATKPFQFVFAQLDNGSFHDECSEELRKLALKLREHAESNGNAKGKMVITLDFVIEKGLLVISPNLDVKAPKAKRKSDIMWITSEGNLSAENPKQLPLVPRAVPAPAVAKEAAPTPQQVKEA